MDARKRFRRTGRVGLGLCALLFLMAATAGAQTDAFAGKWLTDFGGMDLTISGNEVTGSYERDGGTITGTVSDDGATLLGWWSQSPTHQSPDDAGDVILTLSPDGNSFSGTRWRGPSNGPGQPWNGVRVR